ncbi:TrmH family RNA methyltransferase [Candidatus Parcubacteria bacterium]|nr:MAG: TrmH family RNA methyltransferase [Candidatus Parcubacteria bacterium]
MNKLCAKELRTTTPTEEEIKKIKRNDIYIICDNVWDTYNVGAIFRLADAVAAKRVYLCGQTETPPNSRIKKASVNTWQWIPWSYTSTTIEALQEIKNQNSKVKIIAVEQHEKSVPYDRADYKLPIALVVGNETTGISEEVLSEMDEIVELPMLGINTSLNVMVSLGIVLYQALEKNKIG